MGAPSGENRFWQLFRLPAGSTRWVLATPPDVATNGALILASRGGQALVTGIRPSLHLIYSPITATSDGGKTWTSSSPDPGLAGVPDALAAGPAGQLLALGTDGQADLSSHGGTGWTKLATTGSLAATAAGRACGLQALTAAAYTPAGAPLLGGRCARPGVAGIFAYRNGAWQAAGPALPPPLAARTEQVLRLTSTGTGDVAVLQAGQGPGARVLAAWTADHGKHWTLSPPLALDAAQVVSTALGSSGSIALTLTGRTAVTIAGPGTQWKSLPSLPSGRTVTLAFRPAGGLDALAADGSDMTSWQLDSQHARWTKAQAIKVPIQYGSSS